MGGVKVDIIWSPNHDDRFVSFGTDLSLYKVEALKEGQTKPQGGVKISDDTFATLLSVNSDNQFIKCLAWYPKQSPDHLLAVGLANGKVVLSSFGKGGTSDPRGLIGREFVPKHARQCNHLAWNPIDSNLLAEGLDKSRTDHSILIWDVNVASRDRFSEKRALNSDPSAVNKPFVELGPTSEATLSLAWFPVEQKTLVTGMNHKFLKIFDLREIMRPQNMAYTKAVYGVCIDPHFDYRLASFCENSISVWDVRNFDKPVLTLQDSKPVMKLCWSPSRSGLLSALHKDSPVVKLYDIQNAPVGADELEPAVIERVVQPNKNQVLSSFDWHCSHENRMLTATISGIVHDMKIFERISLSWSSDIHMTWACGRQMVQCNTVKLGSDTNEDISIKMKRRAQHGYGLQTKEIWQNAQLAGSNKPLQNLWHWLHFAQGLSHPHEDIKARRGSPGNVTIYLGIKAVLLGDGSSPLHSDPELLHWQGLEGQRFRTGRKIYNSEERSHSLQLCGWGFNRNQYQLNDALNEALTRLKNEGKYERAAAIALFNLNMKQSIEILQTASGMQKGKSDKGLHEGNLSVVAMALSGFTEDNALWQQLCSKEKTQLKNPYLQTMFAFLTTDPEHYENMLNESEIEIIDKVAFASMYLSDSKLTDFVKKLTSTLIGHGSLDGILLTGLGKDGLDLLEQYIDHTCDIQTACLVALLGMQHAEVMKDPRPKTWIENYRSLLDQWKLWHRRAEFDLYHTSCEPSARPTPQVFASCNYCGKSIAYNMLASRNRSYIISGTTSHRPKVTSCPNCRKPLPRCALCLINMGTPAGQGKPKPAKDGHHNEESNRKLTQFSEWFTWCQSCRHGGHAHHLMEWFRDHNDCPVTGCNCHCTVLDSLGNVPTEMPNPSSNRSLASTAV